MTSKNARASFPSVSGAFPAIPYSNGHGEMRNSGISTSTQESTVYTTADPPYISSQLKSSEWLQRYGLKSQKLSFDQILQQIGYKRIESINASGKGLSNKSAGNMCQEIKNDNGDFYVLTCRPEKLTEYRHRLMRMLNLLKKRLSFITSGSRRVFGVIGEPSICFVCDCKTTDPRVFNQYQMAIKSLFQEQVLKIKRFNIVWVSNDSEQYQEHPTDVTTTSIEEALDWISKRKCARSKISISATCEAVLKALENNVHSIYLISEGNSSDSAREILRDNIVKTRLSSKVPIPIHVVSLFCYNHDTEIFLQSIAQTADGSYMSYKINNQIIDLKAPLTLHDPTQLKLQHGTNTSIPKVEQPTNIILMTKEISQCQNIIDRLDKILGTIRFEKPTDTIKPLDPSNVPSKTSNNDSTNLQRSLLIQSSALFNNDENNMASVDWLKTYGVKPQKLDFFTALQSAALRPCDGLVAISRLSENNNTKSETIPAVPQGTLMHAKYCDQFAHVTWPDGTIRHVFITPEIHRDYERRMRALLEKIKARLQWLKKGSRDVFGTVIENNVYILIDTSKSMDNHLAFLKEKLRLLLKDQLFSKERVNMISFNSAIYPWRDRLTKVNESTIQTNLQPWIDGLNAEGSTNTLGAIRFALADTGTEGVYLLTDGRPDQNEQNILSQVQYRQKVPIHTIAFNCQDQTANQFLFDLAKQSGGRFHAFNYTHDSESPLDLPESEDINYLKQELAFGEKELQRVADLRNECTSRAWSRDNAKTPSQSLQLTGYTPSSPLATHNTVDVKTESRNSQMPQITDQKGCSSSHSKCKRRSKSASQWSKGKDITRFLPDPLVLPESGNTPTSTTGNEQKYRPTPYDEVVSYLKMNSLISKKLTIFDVINPISMKVRDLKPNQIIDRYAMAKVWDDLLTLTHGLCATRLRLAEYYAIDLDSYASKLEDLIADYHRFTTEFIWKYLSNDVKKLFGPKFYWISLSKDDQLKNIEQMTNEENQNPRTTELFIWQKLTDTEQQKFLEKAVRYNEHTEVVLKNALQESGNESALQAVERMDNERRRANKFLQISTDLRRYQKQNNTESKQKKDEKQTVIRKITFHFNPGERVLCRYDADGYFYPGTFHKNESDQAIVLFDMDIEQMCTEHTLISLKNAYSLLKLCLLDCVLVRQQTEMEEFWIPGLILATPSPFGLPSNLYLVQIHDPFSRKIYVDRPDMIRISLELYQRAVAYLQNLNKRTVQGMCIMKSEAPSATLISESEIKSLIQKATDPIQANLEDLDESSKRSVKMLQERLIAQMNALKIISKNLNKPILDRDALVKVNIDPKQPPETPSISMVSKSTQSGTSLEPFTIVYAFWAEDDCLVYKGRIVKACDSARYYVERLDLPGIESCISRDDIFIDSDVCLLKTIPISTEKLQSFALVKYPNDSRGYLCPATIIDQIPDQQKTKVRFHNCHEADINNNEIVIPIKEKQFAQYVQLRIDKELSLIDKVAVGFNKNKGAFMLGTIKSRRKPGHYYLVEWHDESTSELSDEHLFGAFTRRDKHSIDDYVLALEADKFFYRLGKVRSISDDRNTLEVQFIDFHKTDDEYSPRRVKVPSTTSFVITEQYVNKIRRIVSTK